MTLDISRGTGPLSPQIPKLAIVPASASGADPVSLGKAGDANEALGRWTPTTLSLPGGSDQVASRYGSAAQRSCQTQSCNSSWPPRR